jgi:hypothetical protein
MTQIEKEIRNQIIIVVSRIPKKNHDTSIQHHHQAVRGNFQEAWRSAIRGFPTQQFQDPMKKQD